MSYETALEVGRLYQPLKAIADAMAGGQKTILALPGLVGYWPMGIGYQTTGDVFDLGGTYQLEQIGGDVPIGYDGKSHRIFDGSNYLSRSGPGQITGTEGWIEAGLRGLTVGGWFRIDATNVNATGLVSRDGGVPNRGWVLTRITPNGKIRFQISANGTTATYAEMAGLTIGEWAFLVGRYTPETELAIWVNAINGTNTVDIPTSINLSTQNFEIGRYYNDNARRLTGKARDVFICAASLSDELIEQIRLATR